MHVEYSVELFGGRIIPTLDGHPWPDWITEEGCGLGNVLLKHEAKAAVPLELGGS